MVAVLMAQCDVNTSASDSCSRGRKSKRLRTLNWMRELKFRAPPYFEEKYVDHIRDVLQVIETDVLFGKQIQWNLLLRVVRAMKVNSKSVLCCLKFLRELCNFFEKHHCKDVNVISEVFLVMAFLAIDNLEFLDKRRWHLMNSGLEEDFFTKSYAEMKKFFCMPYGAEESKQDMVWKTAVCGDLSLLKLQLKFGMAMMTPYSTYDSCLEYFQYMLRRLRELHSATDGTDLEIMEEELRGNRLHRRLTSHFNRKSRRRLCFVFKMLEIVLKMQSYPEFKDHFVECYRLLLDSVPEAHVTSTEVKTYLERCLSDRCSGVISKLTEFLKELSLESTEVPQPRSLKHLCRIQVRQSLRQNLNLPHGVSSLPLPTEMKKYITLNDDDGDYTVVLKRRFVGDFAHQADFNLFPFMCLLRTELVMAPISVITLPERDDCVISFFRNL